MLSAIAIDDEYRDSHFVCFANRISWLLNAEDRCKGICGCCSVGDDGDRNDRFDGPSTARVDDMTEFPAPDAETFTS